MIMRFLWLFLFLYFGISSDPIHAKKDAVSDQIKAYQNLSKHDKRLANIGYRLSKANKDYCPILRPSMGWVLHDIAQYPDAEIARAAFGFKGPISILALIKDGAADRAGVKEGDVFLSIEYRKTNAEIESTSGANEPIISTEPIMTNSKSKSYERMAMVNADINKTLDEIWNFNPDGTPILKVIRSDEVIELRLPIDALCASDYILDARKKIDAGANGSHVRISLGLSNFIPEDDEFAAAVAHELAHNFLQHRKKLDAAKKGKGILAGISKKKRIRITEEEADRLSVWLMANVGFDIRDAAIFHKRLGTRKGRPLFASSTHNGWKKRVGYIEEEIAKINSASGELKKQLPPLLNNDH